MTGSRPITADMLADKTDQSARRWYATYKGIVGPVVRLRTQIEIHGRRHVPPHGPFILVLNHRSNEDPLIVGSVLPHHVRWVVAGYMRDVPVAGWIMERMGVIYLGKIHGRRQSLLREGAAILRRGGIIGIFPEGDQYIFQNDFDAPMAPFHRGFAALALHTGTSVVPAIIRPTREVLRPVKLPAAVYAGNKARPLIPRYKSVRIVFGRAIATVSGSMPEECFMATVRAAMEELQNSAV